MRPSLRALANLWNPARAATLKVGLPYLARYLSTSASRPFKGYNLLVKQPDIRYLTFEGGGAKGVAYIGAMESLQRRGILKNVDAVAGSSAGAMQALLFGLGYSTTQMRDILFKTNMNDFLDVAADGSAMNWIQKTYRTLLNITTKTDKLGRGVYQGDVLKEWLRTRVKDRVTVLRDSSQGSLRDYLDSLAQKNGELTFSDIETIRTKMPEAQMKTMHFTGTNYTQQALEIFNSTTQPDMPIYVAARISASFPWAFRSYIYKGNEYMDGGALNNYPMQIFDNPANEKYCIGKDGANLQALGIRVDTQQEIMDLLWKTPGPEPTNFLSQFRQKIAKYFVGVDYVTAGRAVDRAAYEKYPFRTIQISDQGYSTLNFNLSDADKTKLVESGRSATEEYVDTYLDDRIAVSIKTENLDDLSDYISKDSIESSAKNFDAQMVVQTNLPDLLKDLPYDYFQQEIQKTIEMEVQAQLSKDPTLDLDSLKLQIIPKLQDRLYSLLESALKSKFDQTLTKSGYDPQKFPTVTFDVLQLTGSVSPVSRVMTNVVQNVDDDGNSFLDNVVQSAVAGKKIHDLNQSADQLQSQIDQHQTTIDASQKQVASLEKEVADLQDQIDSATAVEKAKLIEQRQELEAQIDDERQTVENAEAARDQAQSEKDRREVADWDRQKESDLEQFQKEQQERQEAASSQKPDLFKF